jgi:CRISPR-associated endonuclease Cas2
MFDLPVDTPGARRDYTKFRKGLLQDGFSMMQYSVYIRHCANEDNAKVHFFRVNAFERDHLRRRVVLPNDIEREFTTSPVTLAHMRL